MKAVLFCQNPYAFGILNPIKEELLAQGDEYLWYVPDSLIDKFPYKSDSFTTSIKKIIEFNPDAHFVPGNEVPHYLKGVKAQIFHGFAGEKKGHFRIRHYFDLYLTQGPHFTKIFQQLKDRHRNFEVVETGWPKLDSYSKDRQQFDTEKEEMLKSFKAKTIVLYAPTFSPALTSAPYLFEEVEKLSRNPEYLILIKFHDLMDSALIKAYEELSMRYENIRFEKDHNILKYLLMADVLVSDTSSVIYEFLLLNKPVVTFKNISEKTYWDNQNQYSDLADRIKINLIEDPFLEGRKYIQSQFHPYQDGCSARRMVNAVKDYISKLGVPQKRKVSFLRRHKMNKMFGRL